MRHFCTLVATHLDSEAKALQQKAPLDCLDAHSPMSGVSPILR